ncbi:hypothetical protein BDB00DRAFT_862255 [Zychaea mexicana]|uniref:uncharacterized protein n=1 Tax=Zychaea mexicana TaxID=64656 RepID=UPI0022FEE26E|nr:uncharacterized protein BDB00DRAFT_862255 [Zychaea mexicana]KAI9471398.1 hypothetical protein BDB00DRAFT_862255 [Zychaea mexicana]
MEQNCVDGFCFYRNWTRSNDYCLNLVNNSNNHTKRRRSHDPLIQIAYNDNQSNEQLLPNTTVVVACLCDCF